MSEPILDSCVLNNFLRNISVAYNSFREKIGKSFERNLIRIIESEEESTVSKYSAAVWNSRALNVAGQFQLLDPWNEFYASKYRIERNFLFSNTASSSKYLPSLPHPACMPSPPRPLSRSRTPPRFLFPSARLRALLKRSSDTQGTCYTLEHPLVVCTDLILPLVARLLLGSSIRVSLLPLLARAVSRNMWNTCGGSILEGSNRDIIDWSWRGG